MHAEQSCSSVTFIKCSMTTIHFTMEKVNFANCAICTVETEGYRVSQLLPSGSLYNPKDQSHAMWASVSDYILLLIQLRTKGGEMS